MSKHYKPISPVTAADINHANQARWGGGEVNFTQDATGFGPGGSPQRGSQGQPERWCPSCQATVSGKQCDICGSKTKVKTRDDKFGVGREGHLRRSIEAAKTNNTPKWVVKGWERELAKLESEKKSTKDADREITGKVVLVGGKWFYRKPNDTLRYGPFDSATEAADEARKKGIKVDSKTHDSLSESEEREHRRLSNTSNRTSEEQRRLVELSRKKAVSEYGDSEGTEALRNGLNEFLAEEEQEPEHETQDAEGDYEVSWVNREYQTKRKVFKNDPSGAPENALRKARQFAEKLEKEDNKSRSGDIRGRVTVKAL